MTDPLQSFLQQLVTSFEKQTLIKTTLGNRKVKSSELKNVFIKPVLVKKELKLSFVYRYPTKDITKNFDAKEGIVLIEKMMQDDFNNADAFTTEIDLHFSIQKNSTGKIVSRPSSLATTAQLNQHDKEKIRIIKPTGNIYLKELGITTIDGVVKKDKQDKYKQINRYIEIIEGIIKDLNYKDKINVVDMGCGKGYLTFALYDYLVNKLNLQASIEGIELRQDLVTKCNEIAVASGFDNLRFEQGTIQNAVITNTDILIALHACDTATDEAIYSGMKAGSRVIICAPCCHKQIRKQMAPDNALKFITKHGILLERQAEITTDAIRALLLEANGYRTKVFDFIATEHTPKNVLIVGIKSTDENNLETKAAYLNKVAALKELFGIKSHYLETLLELLPQ